MTDLSGAFDPATGEYDYAVLDRELDKAKSKLFLNSNAAFLGPILTSLEFIWDDNIETAATDGERFWWAPKDFLICSFDERVSTVFHEVWHVARLHMLRCGNRDPKKWNYACDIRLNRDLVNDGYKIGHDWVQYHHEIPHELEEDIYDWLVKNNTPIPQNQSKHIGDMKGQGDPAKAAGNAQATINTVVRAIHQANLAGKPGSVPGGIREFIDQFLEPVIDWEKELQDWMQDLLEEDYSWSRPNRRYADIYLPHRFEDDGRLEHLIYYLDVSGSISKDDIIRFNSEVKFVKEQFNPKKMTFVQFDTIIQKVDVMKEDDVFSSIEVIGRGGTCLRKVREHIIKNEPTAAIIFTDLYVAPMEKLPKEIPVLWVSTTKDQRGAFGKTIHIPHGGKKETL